MIRRPPRSTQSRSSAASDVYKRQEIISPTPDNRIEKTYYSLNTYRLLASSPPFYLFLELLLCFILRSSPASIKMETKELNPFLSCMDDLCLFRTEFQLQLTLQNLLCSFQGILCI